MRSQGPSQPPILSLSKDRTSLLERGCLLAKKKDGASTGSAQAGLRRPTDGFALAFEWSVSGSCRASLTREAVRPELVEGYPFFMRPLDWQAKSRTSLKRSTRTRPQGTTRITLTAALPNPIREKRKGHRVARQPRDKTGNVQLYKPRRELGPASVECALSRIWGGGQGEHTKRQDRDDKVDKPNGLASTKGPLDNVSDQPTRKSCRQFYQSSLAVQ